MRTSHLIVLITSFLLIPFAVQAEIPRIISYQGKVTDGEGATVPGGSYEMEFRIYDQETGGAARWNSGTLSIDVAGGMYSVLLGDGNPIDLDFAEDYWLEVEIESDVQSPRLRLGSVGYAYMASGLVPGTEVEGAVSGGGAIEGYNSATTGNVYGGMFDVGPSHAGGYGAGVLGRNTASTGNDNYGGLLMSWGITGRGVKGWALATEGQNYGVYGQSDSNQGRGVYGEATASSNTVTYGGRFESNSGYGRGVYGRASHTSGATYGGKFDNSSTSGVGVAGYATATSGESYGGYFESSSSSGRGVYGEAPKYGIEAKATGTSGTNYGGYFESASNSGRGVWGSASSSSGTNYGGKFESNGETGRGVYGYASHTSGATYGGKFDNNSTSGIAVAGYATATTGVVYGVYGRSYSSSDGSAGVYGRSSNDGNNDGATYGVYGRNDGLEDGFGAPPIGVYGYQSNTSSSTGYGGYFVSNAINGRGVRAMVTSTSGGIGVSASGGEAGGYFEATSSGDWAFVAFDSYKILGGGSVNFVQNHPHNDDEVVIYAAPEGDEVATYTRGTARLVGGEAIVPLGETFKWVTNPDIGLTAHLTPRGDCDGLYVETLTTDEMVVRERRGGTSDVVFDYIVYGLRIGFEEATVVQKKEKEAFIPSMADHREMYSADPYLRQYNALERFRAMHRAIGGRGDLDLTAARSLRDAVQVYDPAIHGEVGTDEAHGSVGENDTRGLDEEPAYPQRERVQATNEENEWR